MSLISSLLSSIKVPTVLLSSLLALSCTGAVVTENLANNNSSPITLPTGSQVPGVREYDEITETFVDEKKIGRPGRNKISIELREGSTRDSAYRPNNLAVIHFYSKDSSGSWVQRQAFEFANHSLTGVDPMLTDFNNDGLYDATIVSTTAARGSNEVRTLFIYDKGRDELIHIKNSEDYPNLDYNKTLDCIDSYMVHGASTTVFLKLDGDLLKEFASVGTGAELVVSVVAKDGSEKVIRREKMSEDDIYTRYRTFNPPRP